MPEIWICGDLVVVGGQVADQRFGRLTNPEPWQQILPAPLFKALAEWIRGQPFDLTHRSWLTSGGSGSIVAVVWLRPQKGMLQGAVLKLVPPELGPSESRGVALAKQHVSPDFFAAHMIETRWAMPLPGSGWYVHLQEVAQADLARMVPLAELIDDPRFGDYCETVLRTIVNELNVGDDDPAPTTVVPSEFLHRDLGSVKVSKLRAFLAEAGLGTAGNEREILLPGRPDPLPNPIALMDGALDAGPVEVFRGNGHGDLHLQNILVPVEDEARPEQFRLIDFGRFAHDIPVSRDPMKLLLSVADAWLPALAPRSAARSSLAELIVRPQSYLPGPAVSGYIDVARKVHEAAGLWGIRRGLSSDWIRQNILVLAASALRTVADDTLAAEERWWYLEVAALCTEGLLPPNRQDGRAATNTPPSAVRPEHPNEMPSRSGSSDAGGSLAEAGLVKLRFCQAVADSWQDLADVLVIRPYDRRKFDKGDEARGIWEWLEVRGRLDELRGALLAIERPDLARMLDAESR
ncbi:hypothetical protein ACQP2Y_15040 [Actinoplanes sp. CA-051413]|uniref:hypothetical protein n=1 Tax=Actinoplanes sp. CA-051413 TaxID=3239899 RepID=UPI003D973A34